MIMSHMHALFCTIEPEVEDNTCWAGPHPNKKEVK